MTALGVVLAATITLAAIAVIPFSTYWRYLLGTSVLVVFAAWLCVWIASLDALKTHPDLSAFFGGMPPELVGTVIAVVVIEALLQRHETAAAAALSEQQEFALRIRLPNLLNSIRRASEVSELSVATLWTLDRTDRQIEEAETAMLRLAPLGPSWRHEIERFVRLAASWRDQLFECHRWVEERGNPADKKNALDTLNQTLRDLLDCVTKVRTTISPDVLPVQLKLNEPH